MQTRSHQHHIHFHQVLTLKQAITPHLLSHILVVVDLHRTILHLQVTKQFLLRKNKHAKTTAVVARPGYLVANVILLAKNMTTVAQMYMITAIWNLTRDQPQLYITHVKKVTPLFRAQLQKALARLYQRHIHFHQVLMMKQKRVQRLLSYILVVVDLHRTILHLEVLLEVT